MIMTIRSNSNASSKKNTIPRSKKTGSQNDLYIESFGVKIKISTNTIEGIESIRKIISEYLPKCFQEIDEIETENHFRLKQNPSGKDSLYKNGDKIFTRTDRQVALEQLGSQVRLTVAEFAVGSVFIHAGVVCWKDKAIIFPGKSFSGKTSLTAALVKCGAIYYSDEFAILDEDGLVHPFPKTLSVRGEIDAYTQVEYPVEALGGTAGKYKIPVGMVLITEYKENARWNPRILSNGEGIMEIIKNTVSIRNNPNFVLSVLNKMSKRSQVVKSKRGDTSKFTQLILDFFESECLANVYSDIR